MQVTKISRTLIVSAFVLSMASCSLFSGRETAGQYVDDATITTKVKEAFVADPQIKASQVNVETMQGTVQLSGFVDSPASETRAVEKAYQIPGVKSVKDDIIVRSTNR